MLEEEEPRGLIIEEVTISDWVFRVRWEHDRFRADFTVWRAELMGEEGEYDDEYDDDEVEASGSVVWDGCMNLDAAYNHWCQKAHMQQYCQLLSYLYARGQGLADA